LHIQVIIPNLKNIKNLAENYKNNAKKQEIVYNLEAENNILD
jgi:hypothetical protein